MVVPCTQLVLMAVTVSVNCPPCGTQLGDTLVMAALDGVTVKVNGYRTVLPDGPTIRFAVMLPTLASG